MPPKERRPFSEKSRSLRDPKREFSNKPTAIKSRLKNGAAKIDRMEKDLGMLYQKPISEWDFQELQVGRPRDEDGKITRKRGKVPPWITPILMAEAERRLKKVTVQQLSMYAGDAILVMVDLMKSSPVDKVRFQAAEYVLNQIVGMPLQRVETEATVNVHTFLADVIRNPDGREHMVIEGTVGSAPMQYEGGDEDGEDDDGE